MKRRNATVCCPPTSSTLQLCRERCFETFLLISSQPDRAPCRCVNGGRRSSSGACGCSPGYFGNCCQEKIIYPDTYNDDAKEKEEGLPDQLLQDDSAKHGCEHDSHENDQHHGDEEHNSSCEDDTDDGSSNSSLSAGAVTAIVLVSVGSLVGAFVIIAVLCHKKRATVAAAGGATTGVVVVKPPKPTASVYTIDVKQKNKMADDVTTSPPAYWEAVEASAPPSYQSYLALNEVGLDGQARSAKH